MLVYKIFLAEEWEIMQKLGETVGAPIDVADGYVHMSTAAQVVETADKYFGKKEGLMLLAIETDTLGGSLKWEESRGGALFPHLFRKLKMDDVVWAKPLPLGADGHSFPEGVL